MTSPDSSTRLPEATADRERIAALEHELDALLHVISHDMRAPLRGIQGFAGALHEDYAGKLDKAGDDYLRRISAGARRLDRMLEGVVKLGRLNRHPVVLSHEDVTATAVDILNGLRQAEPGRAVTVYVTPGMEWNTDRKLFRVALDAVLDNAWKFTRPVQSARIEVRIAPDSHSRLVIRVSDNGVGFDAAHARDRLGSLFQRFHPPEDFPGEGLGLAMARRVLMRLGGTLSLESTPGGGTVATLKLPSA